MKQSTIIFRKLWDAWEKGGEVVFPTEFYDYNEIIDGISKTFDSNHVTVNIKPCKTEKGFPAISVSFLRDEL